MSIRIPFNRPYTTGREVANVQQAIANGRLAGNGPFARRCADWLERETGAARALLTTSCTSALELAAILVGVGPGDEVVMPSYTFVSTASSVALRGAVPVFVDVRPDTLNLDERLVEAALTPRTRAILPMHYAGVACELHVLREMASRHRLRLVEDAAQGLLASYHGHPLGCFGSLAALSFHETKNVVCGEGGALLVNDPDLVERAEIVHEKGTDRQRFFRGQVDEYTWVDLGSSFPLSEVNAAFLWAQLEDAHAITAERLRVWHRYHAAFADIERREVARRPVVPDGCGPNGHLYYLLLRDEAARDRLIADLAAAGVQAVFHYVPLHSSPAGRRLGRASGRLRVTDDVSARLVRLPVWPDLGDADVDAIVEAVHGALRAPSAGRRRATVTEGVGDA